jgi:hypothetical protein
VKAYFTLPYGNQEEWSKEDMPTTVYIWYPHMQGNEDNVGHVSMHIGDHAERNNNQFYVSWWPGGDGTIGPMNLLHLGFGSTMEHDEADEGAPPHVTYTLHLPLDEKKMISEWDEIRQKVLAHYHIYEKNCATVVARVLRAGGADDPLNMLQKAAYAHNLAWTPKDVAQWCNLLCKKNLAHKEKASAPGKWTSMRAVLTGKR